ncbi:ATP-dependent nuclease [Bacillus toyonensis]|uniref:ATP-dependent nuclease n=1 Tax=Bacillus toyonensis TaxID=155322 RepID=UPI002E2409A9|nr:AAA family ATPase [Bacillus toyonensis]MED3089249.1 AAA family ATPase [Bacillus toyonensis]
MTYPFDKQIHIDGQFSSETFSIKFYDGITTFVGPNGSGKSQVLRRLKDNFGVGFLDRKVRLLTAGRLSRVEDFRANHDGFSSYRLKDDRVTFGGLNYREHRHLSEGALGDFHTLSLRQDIRIKVSERLSILFNRNIFIEWDAGELKIRFSSAEGEPYSAAREASGLLHLVTILSALYDDEVSVLLLDEPEISLHPQLQAFLFQEIKKVAGDPQYRSKKMVILATHSTEFVNLLVPEDLTRIVFFENTMKPPVQIDPGAGELQNRKVRELLTRLGQAHKSALFSLKPLLVEGPSDVLICNALNQHLQIFLEAGGSQLVPIIGKGEIPGVIKLMRLIGKKPVLITDLDTVADDITSIDIFANDEKIIKTIQKMGHIDFKTFSRNIHDRFTTVIDGHWEDVRPLAEKHSYWINRDGKKDVKIAKRRAGMATLFASNDEELSRLNNGDILCGIKQMLTSLFDILELSGCFVLRKGTIENYYLLARQVTEGKPTAAVEEIEFIISQPKEYIETAYADLVRGLKYAATHKEIDEGNAIINHLLSAVTPLLNRIDDISTDAGLQLEARKYVGEIADIFKFSKIELDGIHTIRAELDSSILEINGLPIDFPKGVNPIDIANRRFKGSK